MVGEKNYKDACPTITSFVHDKKLNNHGLPQHHVEIPQSLEFLPTLESDPPPELIPILDQIKHKFKSELESH